MAEVAPTTLDGGGGAAGGAGTPERPRVLVVLPTWLGDTVMATPALRLVRRALGTCIVVGLCRAGIDELLAGTDFFDDLIVAEGRSVLGPAKTAARLKPYNFDAALLLPNSFSSAITVRLAGIPRRVGYDRDGRSALLTHHLRAPRRAAPHTGWAAVSAVDYYLGAARACVAALGRSAVETHPRLELALTPGQERDTGALLARAGVPEGGRFAVLNPGGNNPAKRWPAERFSAVAHHLIHEHGMLVAINGSPGEAGLAGLIRDALVLNNPEEGARLLCLPELGGTIGTLKGLVRRCEIMVSNDTGPRHIAAAFDKPCVSLFGPTDARWTALPARADGSAREVVLVADATLPEGELADDHPQRCRVDRITTAEVLRAVDGLLGG